MLPLVSHGANLFNLCPFPDSPALYVQNLFPIGLAFWIIDPLKKPKIPPWDIVVQIVFSLCPFPDESADMYQIWCQSVESFDSFPRHLNLWPPKTPPPKMPPEVLWGDLYLAYVHSQMNPQTCTKCGANRSSCLTASQDFWICDPLKLPGVLRGELYLAYVDSQTNLQICTKFGANQSSRLTAFLGYWGATWI